MLVDGPRNQILSHAAFPADQNGDIRRRDALHQRQHRLHLLAMRDDIGVFVASAEGLAQTAVFLAQAVGVQLLANHQHQFRKGERLQHVVACAGLHRIHGGLDRTVRRHDHDRHLRVNSLGGLEEVQPVHPGQSEVSEKKIKAFFVENLEGSFGVRRALHLKPFVGELQLHEPPQFRLVLHDEYRFFFLGHFRGSPRRPPKSRAGHSSYYTRTGAQARTSPSIRALPRESGDIRLDAGNHPSAGVLSRGGIDDATVETDRKRHRVYRLVEQGYPENLRRGPWP